MSKADAELFKKLITPYKMQVTTIKGKPYIEVNERLKHFRSLKQRHGEDWSIESDVQFLKDGEEVLVTVTIKNPDGRVISKANAHEVRQSSYINKTSFVENGETSALGRALGFLGIGIDTSIATADEVDNAIKQQAFTSVKKNLTKAQFEATMNGTQKQAIKVLKEFNVKDEYKNQLTTKFKINE